MRKNVIVRTPSIVGCDGFLLGAQAGMPVLLKCVLRREDGVEGGVGCAIPVAGAARFALRYCCALI